MTKTSPAAQGTVADVEAAFRRHIEANDYAKDLIKRIAFDIVPMVRALAPSPEALPASGVEEEPVTLGTSEFMDPPDGGDVSLAEQVRRMEKAYKQRGEDIAALMAALDYEKAERRKERAALTSAPAPAPSGSGVREAMEEARFALFCSDMRIKDRADQALRLALASLASDASPRGEAVAWAQTGYEAQLARYGAFPMRSEKDEALGYVEPLYAHPAPAPAPAEVVEALRQLIVSWEAMPGNRFYGQRQVEDWLADHMKPAIDQARRTLWLLASPAPASETEGGHG